MVSGRFSNADAGVVLAGVDAGVVVVVEGDVVGEVCVGTDAGVDPIVSDLR